MKKLRLAFCVAAIGTACALIFTQPIHSLGQGVGRRFLLPRIQEQLQRSCKDCQLEIQEISLSVFPPGVSLSGVHWRSGDPRTTEIKAEIGRISARASLRRILQGEWVFHRIGIERPDVSVLEGDLPTSSPGPASENASGPLFALESINIRDGEFTYERAYAAEKGKRARLHINDIQGTSSGFGATPEWKNQSSHADITGQLGHSGNFQLAIHVPLAAEALTLDVELTLSDQNLADVSPFFETSDGIRMAGSLYRGHAVTRIRGRRLHSSVLAQYRGLDIHFQKNRERGVLSALFSNLLSSAKLSASDIGIRPQEQVGGVDLERKPRETVISFILRGMRDAAMKVAAR